MKTKFPANLHRVYECGVQWPRTALAAHQQATGGYDQVHQLQLLLWKVTALIITASRRHLRLGAMYVAWTTSLPTD